MCVCFMWKTFSLVFQERFLNVERVCRRVALIDENGGSILRYALSYLQVSI